MILSDDVSAPGVYADVEIEDRERSIMFEAPCRLVHGANLLLPGGGDIEAQPGDYAVFVRCGERVRCVLYSRADGRAVQSVGGTVLHVEAGNAGQLATLDARVATLALQVEQLIVAYRQVQTDQQQLMRMLVDHEHETKRQAA